MAAAKDKKDKKEEPEENEGQEQAPGKKKGFPVKLVIIVLIVLLVLGGSGAAAYFFYFKPKQQAADKKPTEAAKPLVTVFWPMDPFIVNLLDNEGERFLKVVLQLELSDPKLAEEFNALRPKVRDAILDLLTSKTYKDMMDPNGKQRLRDEIVLRANTYATKGKVLKVYFTEFVIQ